MTKDPFEGALLVQDAKLHLGTVMAGKASQPFFETMLKIVNSKVHLGYVDLMGRKAILRGIKDFISNVNYGLGVRDRDAFMAAICRAAAKETGRERYGYNFIDWLKGQDSELVFPPHLFEYRRLTREIAKDKLAPKKRQFWLYNALKAMYLSKPELVEQIGPGKKYKSIEQCYFEEGFSEKRETLEPIKIFKNPTNLQVKQMAEILYKRLGGYKTKILVSALIDEHKRATNVAEGEGTGVSDLDDDPAGA
jgi:hypothetical protein